MTEELKNKIKLYWDEYYLKDEGFKLFDQLFTEEEVYQLLCAQEEGYYHDSYSNTLIDMLTDGDYDFKGNYIFDMILGKLDNLTDFRRSGLLYFLEKLNDDQAYEILKKCKKYKLDEVHTIVDRVVRTIDSDEMKERILKQKLLRNTYPDSITKLVKKIKDDNLKIRCLKYVEKYDRPEVIATINSDYLKTKYLTLFAKEKGQLISSLEDDKLREKQLKKYWFSLSAEAKGNIISSFENTELLYKYVRKVYGDEGKLPIIRRLVRLGDRKTATEILSTIKSQRCIVTGVSYLGCEDDVYPYASKLRNDECIIDVMKYLSSDSSVRYVSLLKYCSSGNIFNYLKNASWCDDYLPLLMASYIKNFNNIEKIIDHIDQFPEYDERSLPLILRYAEHYNINRDRLCFFVETLGYNILKYIKSKNVQSFLNLDEESFNKVMQIFDAENFEFNDSSFNDSVNALLQRKFRVQVPEIVMIFPTALQAIEEGNKKELAEMLDVLSSHLVEEVYDETFSNKEVFVNALIAKNDIAIEKLHTLTSKYIKLKRNEYVKVEYDDVKKKSLNVTYDVKKSIKAFITSYPIGYVVHCISVQAEGHNSKYYTEEELALMRDKERLINVIKYRKDPVNNKELLSFVKGDFKLFDSICESAISAHLLDDAAKDSGVAPIYTFRESNREMLFSFFTELDFEKLKNGVLSDVEMFNSMIGQVKQYSLLGWIGNIDAIASESGIPVDAGLIANFVAYYPAIYKELKERYDNGMIPSMTFTSFLDYAACFDSGSKRYNMLFGADNYSLIASNPQPNSSSSSKEERIKDALKYFKIIKTRKHISVPPSEQDITLDGGKKINVNVGNISNSINLTYGERTGACMRVLGAGKTLFDFCLKDENGFHVRFSDPDTGEFVSRVSGFRNGNTVFLNQLRYPVSGKYNNQDIYHACEEIAKILVEKSKGSVTPIDNVVVCADLVMAKSGKPCLDLGVSNIKQGLSNTTFYTDVGSSAILLASSNLDGSLVPLKLGNTNNKEKYDVLREKPKMYIGDDAIDKLQCIEVTDQYLSGVAIEDFDIKEFNDLLLCYVGDDWYIGVDKNKNIQTYIMKNSLNRARAEEELAQALEVIKAKINLVDDSTMKM